MTTPEILDEALKELNYYNSDKFKGKDDDEINWAMPAESLFEDSEFPRLDKFLILDHLVLDEYATKRIKSGASRYWITYTGKMLILSGGYVQKEKDIKTKNHHQTLMLWIASLGAGLAGLYALWKFGEALFGLLYPCGCY